MEKRKFCLKGNGHVSMKTKKKNKAEFDLKLWFKSRLRESWFQYVMSSVFLGEFFDNSILFEEVFSLLT